MIKKILIILITFIVVFILDSVIIFNFVNKDKVINNALSIVNEKIDDISLFLNKYDIGKKGILDVNVNYRGAHGENYPSKYSYKYELTDKLYLEDEEYAYINVDNNVLDIFHKLSKLENINLDMCSNINNNKNSFEITCDNEYINKILNTNFKKINILIYTKGLVKEIDYVVINLDDIKLTFNKDELTINYLNNNIKISFNGSNYYVNINDLLKANIMITDVYSWSIIINNQVYYLEVRDDELYIKFTSERAIYNSINILAKYKDVSLNKEKLILEDKDNPIINYVSNSDFDIWR